MKARMKSGLAAIRRPSECAEESASEPLVASFEKKPVKFGKKKLSTGNKPSFKRFKSDPGDHEYR
jgi:hypothetical protein